VFEVFIFIEKVVAKVAEVAKDPLVAGSLDLPPPTNPWVMDAREHFGAPRHARVRFMGV
jgi:hypothetical protein